MEHLSCCNSLVYWCAFNSAMELYDTEEWAQSQVVQVKCFVVWPRGFNYHYIFWLCQLLKGHNIHWVLLVANNKRQMQALPWWIPLVFPLQLHLSLHSITQAGCVDESSPLWSSSHVNSHRLSFVYHATVHLVDKQTQTDTKSKYFREGYHSLSITVLIKEWHWISLCSFLPLLSLSLSLSSTLW